MKRFLYLMGIIIFSFLCLAMLAAFFSVFFSDSTDNKADCIPIVVVAAVFLAFDVFNTIKYIKSTHAKKHSQQRSDREPNNQTLQYVFLSSVDDVVQLVQ